MFPESANEPHAAERYLQLLDNAPDAMIVVNADGRLAFVNQQTETLFGYGRAELLGMPLSVLVPERFRMIHATHHQRFLLAPTARPMGTEMELFGRRKDGTELQIEVSLSPTTSSGETTTSATIRDVTERRKNVAEGKLTAQRLSSAVESIQDAFALFDAHDILVVCNSVYRRLVGDALPGAILGRSYHALAEAFASLATEDPVDRALFVADRLAERTDPKGSYDVQTSDGRRLRVSNRRTPEGGIVKTVWDLTGDMEREEELKEARVAADAGSAAKSDFLSSISHELRTPMNAILGFAQLLQRDKKEPLSARHRARVDQILKGGEHLLHLIDDVLDLSRIEGGNVAISLEPVTVGAVLREVRETLGPLAARSGITLDVVTAAPSSFVVLADRTRFAQILLNFGSNAVKYNRPEGSVSFGVSAGATGRIRVTVHDTGFGIPPAQQNLLFQPFQRAGQEAGPIEGTGIGLAICKRLAEMMNGTVGFESHPLRGSTFWVELPTYEVGPSTAPPPPEPPVPPIDAHLDRSTRHVVLYVEDNPANVAFLEDVLSIFAGIEVLSVPTAELGIELARARLPEVIILDINLPGMSGLEALRVLRDLPETRNIPVIALTAAASERDRQRGEQAGFYRYLTKPVKVSDLETALAELLPTT